MKVHFLLLKILPKSSSFEIVITGVIRFPFDFGLATGINLDTWNSFTLSEQSIIRQVLAYENTYTLAEFNHHNAIALDTLINKHKVKMRTFSDEIMSELKVISEGVIEEVSTRTEISKRIFNSFKDSMQRLNDWSSKSEQAYMKARSIK